MELHLSFKLNGNIFVKDPDSSDLGRKIVKTAIDLIYELGFEQFTFKKLALNMNTTEATIYRYFENKHRLLLYILNWYWSYVDFLMAMKIQGNLNVTEKLNIILNLLTHELPNSSNDIDYNKKYLNHIVIAESSKTYLVKDIKEINDGEVFKPYKDLCAKIAEIILEYSPNYPYSRSLATTLIGASHQQQFFLQFLPKLTDKVTSNINEDFTQNFLTDLLFKAIKN